MKKKNRWSTIILLSVFFIGLIVLLYPTLSDYWNSKTQSKAIADYESVLANLPQVDYTEIFAEADEYNAALAALDFPIMEYGQLTEFDYNEILNVSGTGMMGFVEIDKIGVELPLYHGTGNDVLSIAIGHLEGTSLPSGGSSTHMVISAHRGLPSARLFTDLDRLEKGDIFQITVLDRVLTYEVDKISIVSPDDAGKLVIEEGEDYCTLLTCTPYGVNTERLLVRGTRIETNMRKTIRITADAYQIDTLIVTPIVALPMIFVLLLIVLFAPVKKENTGDDLI